MTRYKEVYNQMISDKKALFVEFQKIHDQYALDPQAHQDKFNEKGKEIMNIVRHYEDILCGRSEGTGYGAFSGKLAEKFQEEVRKHFPKIDHVGVKMKPGQQSQAGFNLKKINL